VEFAARIGASPAAVQKWENGRNRPAPNHLKRMAELVPALAAELQKEIAAYEWHRGRRAAPPVLEISTVQREIAERLTSVLGLDATAILNEALSRGLQALASSSTPTSRKIADHMEVHDRVRDKLQPGNKRSRKRKAS